MYCAVRLWLSIVSAGRSDVSRGATRGAPNPNIKDGSQLRNLDFDVLYYDNMKYESLGSRPTMWTFLLLKLTFTQI